MRHDSESLLETAIHAIHAAEPDATQISTSAKRAADRLGINSTRSLNLSVSSTIESCADVQQADRSSGPALFTDPDHREVGRRIPGDLEPELALIELERSLDALDGQGQPFEAHLVCPEDEIITW